MKVTKKEVFNIPNMLGYFRVLLIPIFIYLYLNAQTTRDYYMAATVIFISGITDLFDGKIARRFNMISELGKVLDPVADKLTHIAIIFCLLHRFSEFYLIAILFVGKELTMILGNLISLKRRGRKLDGAKWFGKVMTTVLYICLFAFIAIPNMPNLYLNILMRICEITIVLTWVLYISVFYQLMNEKTE